MSPLKIFEAMANGRPILASDLPAVREVLRDGHNALLAPPDDIDAWIDRIRALQSDPGLGAQARRARAAGPGARAFLEATGTAGPRKTPPCPD